MGHPRVSCGHGRDTHHFFAILNTSTKVLGPKSKITAAMTRPRSQLVSVEATPYYHCTARCVRRSWLCGDDRYTGKNFDHRKAWVLERMKLLAEVFAIDIAAYAVLSNHYHVVLHINMSQCGSWSDEEVVARWTRLYAGPKWVKRYKAGTPLSETETKLLGTLITRWRDRLCNISWFMRCLNEYIARRANAEDECKGRFWEGRFKSQALLDETALLSCMTYVDLNPVRAGITDNLENSDFTSIQERIREVQRAMEKQPVADNHKPRLMPFIESLSRRQTDAGIPFKLLDYLELAEWTGRVSLPDKKGAIRANPPPLISTIGLSEDEWQFLALQIQKRSVTMLHGLDRVTSMRSRHPRRSAA